MEPGPANFEAMRFSTHVLPERERTAAWREFFSPRLFGGEVEPLGEAGLVSDLTVRRLPGLNFLSAVHSSVRFLRTRGSLADGCDDLGIHINMRACTMQQRGREIACAPGQAILVSVAEPGIATNPDGSHFLGVHISRAALAPLVPNPDDAVLRPVPDDSGVLRYLLGYIRFLEETGVAAGDPMIAQSGAAHLRDLIALLFGATRDAAAFASAGGLRAARLIAIKRFVAANLAEPQLSVEAVAVRHGISVRSVQRLFEAEGTTFSDYVLEQRLVQVQRAIADPCNDRRTVIDLALEAGFGDLSHFNRRFRRRFGAPPNWFRGGGDRR